jgi:hypothetical protein
LDVKPAGNSEKINLQDRWVLLLGSSSRNFLSFLIDSLAVGSNDNFKGTASVS